MKYYPVKRNNVGLDFFDSEFENLFRPLVFEHDRNTLMKTDIRENENNYLLEIDMPGFEKQDIDITVENGYLTVTAKKSETDEEKDKKGNYIRRERRFGSCSRSFYVGEIDEDSISAVYNKGILEVEIPKQEEKKPLKKQISIK